jgi:hypothetical protein
MILTTPLEVDGKIYDRYDLNLIISGTYTSQGQPEASFICVLTPTRITENGVEHAPSEYAKNIRIGTLSEADEITLNAVGGIQQVLQTFINSKGY